MAGPPNPRLRARIELMIRIAAPLLDLALLAGQAASGLLHRGPREPLATTGDGRAPLAPRYGATR